MAGVHNKCPVCGSEAWDDALLPCGYTSRTKRCGRAVVEESEEDWKKLVRNRKAYMFLGDCDKPFHRPECSCRQCEEWRVAKGRPTHQELNEMDA